ncbi:MAG: exodeoxyribonuclease VII large subunit [Chitinophagales bacterium]
MSETISGKTIFSLLEVTTSIKKTLADRYQSSFWVKAEMIKLNYYSHSGHCYPELVEKRDGNVVAQIRSNLWNKDYVRINNTFLQILKEPLKDGIKILFLAKVSFDAVHGLALNIIDIDPGYTLGDLEKDKQETIKKLQEEGIFHDNKKLKLPLIPQRIAIISVETSKGYADFMRVIENNDWGYKFFHLLFPSLLQGEKAVDAIINQLNRIKKVQHHFDAVAIIRGGGGDIGLSCYNNYRLAKAIVSFPIPVITGIGHATNLTVVEMIAFENAITPTRIAEYLLQKFHNYSVPVNNAVESIHNYSRRLLNDEKMRFNAEVKLFRSVSKSILVEKNNVLNMHKGSLQLNAVHICNSGLELIVNSVSRLRRGVNGFNNFAKQQLSSLEKNIMHMDPANVLKRGYSITLHNGKAVKDVLDLMAGDQINTITFQGEVISTVNSTKTKTDHDR